MIHYFNQTKINCREVHSPAFNFLKKYPLNHFRYFTGLFENVYVFFTAALISFRTLCCRLMRNC